ncbi:membrane-bound lytic murein transglycosylase MltC [Vibrio quintilis]|uniref:Membrane-bound lytic murein transglycosylase C n=1 Tax=Vibrio quintilis TaxID=1117707 RepID=A0A1M7YSN6_9VIBR|nr:membrane-bound lytic murein transglycosylase MltC [Vibrio quintilis]SHO55632.1 Membrane-bound lytic murein transglycosylase C precursor [Vibrio quintilis]
MQHKTKSIFLLAVTLIGSGCSRETVQKMYDVDFKPTNRFAKNLASLPGQFQKDTKALDALIQSFTGKIEKRWGTKNVKIAGKTNYVKYIDDYSSRADVNFNQGKVVIETVSSTEPLSHLKKAIVTTLLTPDDPKHVDLFSSKKVAINGKPFLYRQIVDQDNKPIEWSWRANRFADYLIQHQLKVKQVNFRKSYYVEIPMVDNQVEIRSYKYASLIRKASRKYGIPEDLIYAIIKTESSFNPYAVSWANAYGLMQVVPKTAGKDVFSKIKKRSGQPSPEYLYNPGNNIDTGTAYFYLLKNKYLNTISNPTSLQYSMISAYNGGAGGVLNTFSKDRQYAFKKINNLKPNQLYWALTHKHPNKESRRYLQKVKNYKDQFNAGKL